MNPFRMNSQERTFAGKHGARKLLLRSIYPEDLDLVLALQAIVHEHMPDPSQLSATDRQQIRDSIEQDVCIGAFDADRLVAFGLLVANRDEPARNMGQKFGFPPEECVTFDTAFVHPNFRGLGLQTCLLAERENAARQMGAKLGFVSVAPENAFSLRNVQKQGFEVYKRTELYGGLDRYVLIKRFGER